MTFRLDKGLNESLLGSETLGRKTVLLDRSAFLPGTHFEMNDGVYE